ncbi:MAG: hypothetical protein WBD40_11300 [Tepidisphaeraceae bacterium]
MRTVTKPIVIVLSLFGLLAAQLAERRVNFEADETGQPPKFFTPAVTGNEKEGTWVVEEVKDAPSGSKVLAQRDAKGAADRFALCLYDSVKVADIDLEVQLKPIAGESARAGGLAARCIDRNNYYVVRADALEGNVRLYCVVQGRRTLLVGQPARVDANRWHKLRFVVSGRHFQVYFNDIMLIETDDDTFRDPGNFGLWTEADSVTQFDDFVIKKPN